MAQPLLVNPNNFHIGVPITEGTIKAEENIRLHNLMINSISHGANHILGFSLHIFFLMLNAVDQDGKFLFLMRVLCPLLARVFLVCNTEYPGDEAVQARFIPILQNHHINLWYGAHAETYAQANCADPTLIYQIPNIFINEIWMDDAQRRYAENGHRLDFYHEELNELNIHVMMCVLKLFHEFSHTLTREILLYEIEMKRAYAGAHEVQLRKAENVPYRRTPIKIGSIFITTTEIEGDMGYGCEEIILGNRLRMEMDTKGHNYLFNPKGIYFEQAELVAQAENTIEEKLFLLRVDFERDFERNQYIRDVRQALHNLTVNQNSENGRAAYDAFRVNILGNQLHFQEEHSRRIPKMKFLNRNRASETGCIGMHIPTPRAPRAAENDLPLHAEGMILRDTGERRF